MDVKLFDDVDVYIKNQANIANYPTPDHKFPDDTILTVGDIHGNVMKIIWILIYENIVLMTDKQYYRLLDMNNRIIMYSYRLAIPIKDAIANDLNINNLVFDEVESKDFNKNIKSFIDEIKTIRFNKNIKNITIRFLGDVFFDRGANDVLTLELLNMMMKEF